MGFIEVLFDLFLKGELVIPCICFRVFSCFLFFNPLALLSKRDDLHDIFYAFKRGHSTLTEQLSYYVILFVFACC